MEYPIPYHEREVQKVVLEGFKGSFMEIWIAIALVLAFLSTVDFEGTRRTRTTHSYKTDYSLLDPNGKFKK